MIAADTVAAELPEASDRAPTVGDVAAGVVVVVVLVELEAAGGDKRGRQSAALQVEPAQGEAWKTTNS